MKKLALVLTLFLSGCTLFALPETESVPTVEPEDGLPGAFAATGAITNSWGSPFCSGVFWRSRFLTAAHCVDGEDAEHLIGTRTGWDEEQGRFLGLTRFHVDEFDAERDFAVLSPMSTTFLPPARARLAEEVFVGDRVVAIGHPLGLAYTFTEGRLVAKRYAESGFMWYQISAEVSPGNSGGPVFSRWGEIVGIVIFRAGSARGEEAHLAGAVSLDTIRDVLDLEELEQ